LSDSDIQQHGPASAGQAPPPLPFTPAEEHAMRQALDQAQNAWLVGEVPVGAVIVRRSADGTQVIATGYNRPITEHDPTAHAEIVAMRQAGQALGHWRLLDCALVVTLEQPTPYFLRLAATPALFPLPRRVIAAHGRDWATPELLTTNGPFVLADASDAELTLTRSETYWGERPALETIHVRLFPEGSDAAQAQETLQVVSRNLGNLYVQQAVLRRTVWAWHSTKAG
jgi:hypothetical protein